ncbi:hypothetical protein B0O99DRAFT_598866 [Bisporella sp. PMI_857]|nr:hypothetical protein B0O99DRAFT_598866 [Bisporella sp. PMI_857]
MATSPDLKFTRLNSIISLYTPPPHPPPSSSLFLSPRSNTDPTIIILAQWMGASPRSKLLLSIYVTYAKLYPAANIITIASRPEFFFTTPTYVRQGLFEPVVDFLRGSGERNGIGEGDRESGVLVHTFSNGGALSVVDVCSVFKEKTGRKLGIKGLVLDSAPGDPSIQETWAALSMSLPKSILWYPSAAVLCGVLFTMYLAKSLFSPETLVLQTRRLLNDPSLVDPGAKRMYVYSNTDALVGWRDVERHAKEASEKGVYVELVKMEDSKHVQHVLKHWDVYWTNLESFWKVART